MAVDEAPGGGLGWFKVKQSVDTVTRAVVDSEPCFYLGEFNLPSRSGKSRSRFQLLRVVRNDTLVTAYVYLGPAGKFLADQFQMIGGTFTDDGRGQAVHTVAELQEGARELRSRPLRREIEPQDLQGAFRNHIEERGRRARHASTFGPGGHVARQ